MKLFDSYNYHSSIRKPIKTLPETPEQFLRSGSATNKSKYSSNSFLKNFNMFESPKTVSSLNDDFDRQLELKKLEAVLNSKEKRLSEQELAIKIENEELKPEIQEKCE